MINKLSNWCEVARRIGWRALQYRLRRELSVRLGLAAKIRPVTEINNFYLRQGCPKGIPGQPEEFKEWWSQQQNFFFIDGDKGIKWCLERLLSDKDTERLQNQAHAAITGKILAFRGWMADFGNPVDWNKNPATFQSWPCGIHSLQVLTKENRKLYGDIKLTWEVGRFLHIPDILRAAILFDDDVLIDDLFSQIASFASQNPMHQGLHWISEQEVGIRTCMFTFCLYVLKNHHALTGERLLLLVQQIVAGADYCYHETEFARHCVRNNHFIGGALGMYLSGCVFPWHKNAFRWKKRGRKYLIEALNSQWWDDGGYIQPSHNYHRLALSYLLWVLRLAEAQNDDILVNLILERFALSFPLLYSMSDVITGQLPNWGPNDGALFCPWTSCDYTDFRPLLASLFYALKRKRLGAGLWEEQLFWLWGEQALESPICSVPEKRDTSFPMAGLHTLRKEDDFAVLRCGPVLSRYGQQADQLHVDCWWRGRNVLQDAGSYLYGEKRYHNWFRSTCAHNTITVNDLSQMVPYSQFLFLQWTNASLLKLPSPPTGIRAWYGGYHTGYEKLISPVSHIRLLADINETGWLVVDYLHKLKPGGPSCSVSAWWHMLDEDILLDNNKLSLNLDVGEFSLSWKTSGFAEAELLRPLKGQVFGWSSRYYGKKEPAPTLRITANLDDVFIIAVLLGSAAKLKNIDFRLANDKLSVDGIKLSLRNILRSVDK